jgi:oligosaccharide 4-alpha-D-glucosyltransferase
MNRIFTLITFLIFGTSVFAQGQTRTYVSMTKDGNSIVINVSDGSYHFTYLSPDVVQTAFVPNGESMIEGSHAIITLESSVQLGEKIECTEYLESLVIKTKTSKISVKIHKQPFNVEYLRSGERLFAEKNGFQKMANGNKSLSFSITNDEALYGGGARALGMNRRGNRLELYNRAHYGYEERSTLMNYTMPIVISSKRYMIHFDNAPIGFLDLDSEKNNSIVYETVAGRMVYQVIGGNSWEDLIANYTSITGRQPLPPRWAFGNFASRFGYHSQAEVEYTVDQFFKDSIPLDAVILDLYWFGKEIQGTMGNLKFYTDSFPAPDKMIQDLNAKNIHTVLITEPFILTTSDRWKEAVDNDILCKDSLGKPFTYNFYFGNTGLIDVYSEAGKKWFWNIYHGLIERGVSGFWGDLGEPEVHPHDLRHANGPADWVHNIYGHDWAGLIHNGYKLTYPNVRPFILMRAGAAGSQRYGMIPWSGDVNRTWGGLRPQTEISLQMGLQGIGYMHSDLGGFGGANDDPELYVRWLQYGVFQPIFRPHAQEEVASEPVFKDTETKALAKKAVQLRYDLLPYNYTLAYINSTKGTPLMRPLFYMTPNDTSSYRISSTYLWGDAFLVTPVTDPKASEVTVSFPTNTTWFDYYSPGYIRVNGTEGIAKQRIRTTMDHIPTYVKSGTFVTLCPGMKQTSEFKPENIDILFYLDPNISESSGICYTDNGTDANAIENQEFSLIKMRFKQLSGRSVFDIYVTEKAIKGAIADELVVRNVPNAPKSVKVNNKNVVFSYNQSMHEVRIQSVGNGKKNRVNILW